MSTGQKLREAVSRRAHLRATDRACAARGRTRRAHRRRGARVDGLTDEELLSIAATEGRIFVTFDVKDFPTIARRWAEAGRTHAGCAIVVSIDHGEFGAILETIARELAARPKQTDWTNLTLFLARTPPR